MGSPARSSKQEPTALEKKRMGLKEKYGQPDFILEQMSQFLKEGDVASITDLISSYVANSRKYSSQEEFAATIGTTRQTLHRMLSHSDSVSIKVFFNAIERIFDDAQEAK